MGKEDPRPRHRSRADGKPTYTGDEDGFDVMARLTATETLAEHLRWLWRMSCNQPGRLKSASN
jgi:hypothetical protein